MKDHAPDESIVDALRDALSTEALPRAARGHATHLLNRLSSPVRVTLVGSPGAGKTELVNMFLGKAVVPRGLAMPTTEVVYGEEECLHATDARGRITKIPGLDFMSLSRSKPAFVRMELPLPILKKISLLELVTDGNADELRSAIDWAIRRTDITLWCSQEFGESERALWARVPDGLKDHAFLVLTKADVLSAKNALSDLIASLETVVAEEFHSMFAVATLQAIKSFRPNGTLDEVMYHGSGGSALSSEVLRHAERGRRADIDSAQFFLARYQASGERVISRDIGKPASQETGETAERMPAPKVFTDAVRFLQRRGATLFDAVRTAQPGQTKPVLDQCVDTVEHLIDLFSSDDSGSQMADDFIDDLSEAAEVMVLMQVEKGDAPAADAATLLLQLRREMEMKIAA